MRKMLCFGFTKKRSVTVPLLYPFCYTIMLPIAMQISINGLKFHLLCSKNYDVYLPNCPSRYIVMKSVGQDTS